MKSIYYISILIGFLGVALAGCGEVPIQKTNCWAQSASTVTSSTKGANPTSYPASRVDSSPADVIPCR